jgi:hypothetical protein
LAIDLAYKLLCNRTPLPFVTSDHPAVFYNQFMEHRKRYGSNTGLAVKGLQLFLPLSPRHTLVFFDPWAYKVGGKKLTSHRVEVTDEKDVKALNLLQATSANRHLFFNHQITEPEVRQLVQKAKKFRQPEKSQLHEYPSAEGRGSSLLHMHRTDVRIHLGLKCISIPPHVERYELGNQVVHVRDRDLCDLHEEFIKQVEAKRYKASQFGDFLRDKQKTIEGLIQSP